MSRIRRGKIVEIPEEWQGNVCYSQTKRKRCMRSRLKVLERRKLLKEDETFDEENQETESEGE